jgi:hypothetical protein
MDNGGGFSLAVDLDFVDCVVIDLKHRLGWWSLQISVNVGKNVSLHRLAMPIIIGNDRLNRSLACMH